MEFLIVGMTVLLLLVVVFLVGAFVYLLFSRTNKTYERYDPSLEHFPIGKTQAERFGEYGEDVAFGVIEDIAKNYHGYAYRNIALEDKYGYSTELDCVLICKGGFFVIEIKSNKGTIIGQPSDDYWTAIKEEWQEDKKLKNPIKQNQGHINHIKRMAGKGFPYIDSLVIFPFADISMVRNDTVHDLNSAQTYITACITEAKYKRETVDRFNDQFLKLINRYQISHERHVKNIKGDYSA